MVKASNKNVPCPCCTEKSCFRMRAQLGVHMPADPVLAAWQGASELAASPAYRRSATTKLAYEECGAEYLLGIT